MPRKPKKTAARAIMEARNASYASKPSGMMDETDLLLLQQDFAERRAQQEARKARRRRAR
jgi:hypothetical protein